MYSNANNLKSEIVGSVSANDSTVSITPGEGVLRADNTVACLEHYENEICTKREVIKITSITDNTLTVTRSFAVCVMNDKTKAKGDTAFSFDEGDFLSMYLSKELRESLTDGVGENQTAYETMLENLAVPRTCINNCLTTRQSAIDTAYRTKFGGVAGFGNGSDGDCVISEDTFLDAGREYNFRNLTICPDVLVRFEGAGVPTINVWDTFRNCGIIELKAPYVPDCSILECWCSSGKELCNKPTDWGACCGGAGGTVPTCDAHKGYDGCPGTADSGGYGGGSYCRCGPFCPIGGAPDGLNGGRGGDAAPATMGYGGGGGGGGGGRWGNGGNGGMGGRSDTCLPRGGDGGNSGLYGTGGKGGEGGRECCHSERYGYSGNGGNGYYGGEGGESYSCYGGVYAGTGGKGVIKGGTGGCARNCCQSRAGQGGDAITNVYGFHLNARNIWNNCVNARGGEGGEGGRGIGRVNCCALGGIGGNGADGGQMIINYCCMFEEGCFDVRGGAGGRGGWSNAACSYAQSGCVGADGWKVLRSLADVNIQNVAVYAFGDTKLSREDVSAAPSTGVGRGKTVVVYSTETYPETPEDGTLVVENTIRNQYKDTPYTLTLAEGTYYFSFFAYDTENNLRSTEQQTLHIIGKVQYAVVGGGAGGGGSKNCSTSYYGFGGGGGGGGEVLYGTTTIGGNFCTIIGQGGCGGHGELQENGCNGGDTYFGKEIAHGGAGGGAYCCVGLDGWNGGGGGGYCCCDGGATTGTGYAGGKGCYGGGGGGGAFGAGGRSAYGGTAGTGKYFYFNKTNCCCCPIGGGGGGGSCCGAGGGGAAGYGGGKGGAWDGCNATGYGGGGGGGGGGCAASKPYTNGGNGCQGAVLISYPCSCTYNITGANETFICCSYTVHIINTDGTLCIL